MVYRTHHLYLLSVLDLCLRSNSQPVTKKDPITPEILSSIVSLLGGKQASLFDLRTCSIFLLGYAGFLRFSEIVNIQRSHVTFHESHLKLFVTKSKTDVKNKVLKTVL